MDQVSWYVDGQYGRQGSTAHFDLFREYPTGAPDSTLVIQPMSQVTLTDTTHSITLFQGLVTQPRYMRPGATLGQWWLDCVDQSIYLQTRLVLAEYQDKPAGQIITDLVTNTTQYPIGQPTGVAVGTLPNGPVIPGPTQFNYTDVYNAIDHISQLSSFTADYADQLTTGTLNWGSVLDAVLTGLLVTDPPTLTQASTPTLAYIDGSQQFYYIYDAATLRNSATVRGATGTGQRTDTWQGDGQTTQWHISFPLDTAVAPAITVAGVAKTVAVVQNLQQAFTTDFVLVQPEAQAWSLFTALAPTPTTGQTISLTYNYLYPIVSRYTDQTSVASFSALPNGGVFESYVADGNLLTQEAAQLRGKAEVTQYGQPFEQCQFTISEDFAAAGGHIKPGDAFNMTLNYVADSQNNYTAPLNNATFVADKVRCEPSPGGAGHRRYNVLARRIILPTT